ncbi:hypothetical protein BV25DRAFT_1823893 [Artomyces pyxidatus]|uniref:Uncharacterized protein n=1 Tax=Artomyces pyxidatus TaxID=48021 RepID=A0ACB8T6T1_9AGAM|nr:hypothetical protein BV25DRAFT_1823893 [Artomyces pyxidatus]
MTIVDGKLYVFGGTHSTCYVGTNYWMVLDLMTREWRKLSGDPGPLRADFNIPGPWRHTGLWVDKTQDRIWLLFGEADRASAQTMKEEHGAEIGFGYDDCWSWNITSETWRRERIAGNPPSPRSEFACTYNSKLDKVFVFGGYCPNLLTMYPRQNDKVFQFSYYGDTFLFDPATSGNKPLTWKHVLTRGFPTYRAQAHLFSDPETGKVYLFGGYTNTDFVTEAKHPMSRSFGDLWQLRLDMPGGFFDGVDIDEEARTARAGPWQRCFTCGSAGPWEKCGGSCGGRAFFCEIQCLKEGWKEHKERHNCSKK